MKLMNLGLGFRVLGFRVKGFDTYIAYTYIGRRKSAGILGYLVTSHACSIRGLVVRRLVPKGSTYDATMDFGPTMIGMVCLGV